MTDTAHRPRSRRPRRLGVVLLLLTALAAVLGLAGCSTGGAGESSDSTAVGTAESGAVDTTDPLSGRSAAAAEAAGATRDAGSTAVMTGPAIISTGTLTLRSDDVAGARLGVDRLLDSLGGTVADERTTAGDDGRVRVSRLQLRVPSEEFDAAMAGLAELGRVTESTRKAQDVTGELVDTQARVRAQEQSLRRVEVLFGEAEDIRDVVAIEGQLSRRQADLDSLRAQLAYLEDQTSLSTITVYLERADERAAPAGPDDLAFVAGLKDGWSALGGLGSAVAAVAGALLPFALVVLVLGVPVTVVLRRRSSRREPPPAAPTAPGAPAAGA